MAIAEARTKCIEFQNSDILVPIITALALVKVTSFDIYIYMKAEQTGAKINPVVQHTISVNDKHLSCIKQKLTFKIWKCIYCRGTLRWNTWL